MQALLDTSTNLLKDAHEALVRVLIVDDDVAFRHLCKRYLNQSAGDYEVAEADGGAAAISLYESQLFDCLLVDYNLPDMSGTELIGLLTEQHERAAPMIVLTATGSEEIATESLLSGASDYLPKHTVSASSLDRSIRNAVETTRLRHSVEKRSLQLEKANEELRRKNDEIQRFYHTVSHEIKTPLTAAREFISLVHEGVVGDIGDEQKELLTHALDSCDQIASHFNDLIESTRLETGKLNLKHEMTSIDRVITRSVVSVRPAAEAKQLAVGQSIEPGLPDLYLDSGRVVQVLSNLLGNAIKFTDPGGSINIHARKVDDQDWLEIEVQDTGCGMAADHLPRVFDRLYQAEARGDELMGAGLGLGLSIAREIVLLHGGEITVASEVGVGSCFTVRLPLSPHRDNSTEPVSS